MPPHMRVNWEFLAVLRGELAPFAHESEKSELRTDTLWLFPPGYVHGWRGKPGRACEVVVIHFNAVPGPIERVVGEHGFLSAPLTAADKSMLIRLGKSLRRHYWRPVLVSEIYTERALMDLSLVLMRHVRESEESYIAGVSLNKVIDAEGWLRRNIKESPSIAKAARAVGLSASQLRRIFYKIRKTKPQQILNKVRFDKAMHLMAESDTKLEQIAAESGFSSAANFCRAFKAYVGKSPTTWRREIYIQYKKPREIEKAQYDHHGRRYREL